MFCWFKDFLLLTRAAGLLQVFSTAWRTAYRASYKLMTNVLTVEQRSHDSAEFHGRAFTDGDTLEHAWKGQKKKRTAETEMNKRCEVCQTSLLVLSPIPTLPFAHLHIPLSPPEDNIVLIAPFFPPAVRPPLIFSFTPPFHRSVAPISIKGTSGCMKMISRSADDAV